MFLIVIFSNGYQILKYSQVFKFFLCNSFNCSSLTSEGESSIKEIEFVVFGYAIVSRIDVSPANIITTLQNLKAIPQFGGAPYLNNFFPVIYFKLFEIILRISLFAFLCTNQVRQNK